MDMKKPTLMTLLAVLGGVVLAGCIGVIVWEYYSYHQGMQRYKDEVAAGQQKDATPTQRQVAEGKDETEPATDVLAGYTVESSHPRAMYIDKISLRARVLPMSLNPDHSIQAPINIFDAGWYTGSSKPGEKGAAIIDGHASGPSRQGLFAYVETLVAGDKVVIERGDGEILTYEVVDKRQYHYQDVDMTEVMRVHGGDEGMNMITCTGAWVPGEKTFDTRAIIFTRRVS